MNQISREDVEKLLRDPVGFAVMMKPEEMEDVIVAFVSVLNRCRGGQN